MYKSFLTKCSCVLLLFFVGVTSYAAERTILLNSVFEKSLFVSDAFGSTLEQLPINIEIVIDDSDSGIVEIAAGDQVRNDGSTSLAGATLLPQSAIVSLTATIGNVSWTESDLVSQSLLDSGYSYAVYIDGGLDNVNSIDLAMNLVLSNADGLIDLGTILCSSMECFAGDFGYAEDFASTGYGNISSSLISIEYVELTPTEQIADLQDEVEILGVNDAILDSVTAKLEAQTGNNNAAANMMSSFINRIEAQRGKKLTDEQADDLIARANAVIDSL